MEKAGPKVVFGDNSLAETKGYGVLHMGNAIISNVSYVAGLKHNLLSVSQFCDNGFKVEIEKDGFTLVNKREKVVLKGFRQGNIYAVS